MTERQALERRLAKIQGHESTKNTIRYPYILAMTVNTGRRRLNQADFGIPFEPRPVPYDFASSVKQSATLLKALESGKDPIWQAKGDHARHYWFEEAHEMMPYRLYVPQKWDGKSKLPMVLVLHGATRDENFYFDRDGGILGKQAEQHGYLVVCPLGLRPSAEWGSAQVAFGNPATAGRGPWRQPAREWRRSRSGWRGIRREPGPCDGERVEREGRPKGSGTGAEGIRSTARESICSAIRAAAQARGIWGRSTRSSGRRWRTALPASQLTVSDRQLPVRRIEGSAVHGGLRR